MQRTVFSAQLKDGFSILFIKACTNRLLSDMSGMLTVSYHSFLYSIWVQDSTAKNLCQEGRSVVFLLVYFLVFVYNGRNKQLEGDDYDI